MNSIEWWQANHWTLYFSINQVLFIVSANEEQTKIAAIFKEECEFNASINPT